MKSGSKGATGIRKHPVITVQERAYNQFFNLMSRSNSLVKCGNVHSPKNQLHRVTRCQKSGPRVAGHPLPTPIDTPRPNAKPSV